MKERIQPIDGLHPWRFCHFETVGSTNSLALDAANEGDPGQLWITAGEQKAGKARRGRNWVSKPGNMYASLLLIDPAPVEALATLPLVASLALHRAVASLIAGGRPDIESALTIKWPNDLLFDGKKLSGILLEAARDRHGRMAIIIGCGVNCAHYPDNPLYPATSLEEKGFSVPPVQLFRALARTMSEELRNWNRGEGFAAIRKSWLDRATGLGKPLVARFPDHEIEGRFETLDEQGLLILRRDNDALEKVSSADIFFANLER